MMLLRAKHVINSNTSLYQYHNTAVSDLTLKHDHKYSRGTLLVPVE